MRTKDVKKLDPFTPGLVITPEGEFIAMENENHDRFFQDVIGREMMKLGESPKAISKEHNLGVLMGILLTDFQMLPYCGCTPGNRSLDGGYLYTSPLPTLTEEQLEASLSLYDHVSQQYHMDFIEVNINYFNDRFLKRDDVSLELQNKKSTKGK